MTTPPQESGFDASRSIDPFLKLLGELNYAWTNTESLLIHMISGLAHTDENTAVVIFLTLNTTRARMDLVERLAKLPNVDKDLCVKVLNFTKAMQRVSAMRNHYNHCIYSVDQDTGQTRTILMRIADRRSEIKMGRSGELDEAALDDMRTAIAQLVELNTSLWKFFKEEGFVHPNLTEDQ